MDTTTIEAPTTPGFLSLPPEVRNIIYRLLLVRQGAVDKRGRTFWSASKPQLSTQLLRTCRRIHHEAITILYGENTFKITISDASHSCTRLRYPRPVSQAFSRRSKTRTVESTDHESEVSPLLHMMRRFGIEIEDIEEWAVDPFRRYPHGYNLYVQRALGSDYLELKCDVPCGRDYVTRRPFVQDGSDQKNQVTRINRGLVGGTHNVKTVFVGLLRGDARTVGKRWQSPEPVSNSLLLEMYEFVERYVTCHEE